MVVLAVGDVVGKSGISFLTRHLRELIKLKNVAFTIVNGENASGRGIMPEQAEAIFSAGADVITLGNHTWHRKQIVDFLECSQYMLRPANMAPQLPGRGYGVYEINGRDICVINLVGRVGMDTGPDNPFYTADSIIKNTAADIFIVDFHAEATSEKCAMGYYLDGRASVMFGTHTHVPTADERVLTGGLGYITDLGMTGPVESVLGILPEQSISNFLGNIPVPYEVAPGPCKMDCALFDINDTTFKCDVVERISVT